jgi:hypothetical protein
MGVQQQQQEQAAVVCLMLLLHAPFTQALVWHSSTLHCITHPCLHHFGVQNIWTRVDKLMTHDVCGPGTFGIFQKEFGENAQV